MIDVLIKEFSCIILCVPRFSAVCIESLRFSLHRSDTIVPARGHHIGLEIANWPRNPIGGNIDCGFCLNFKCFSWKINVCAKIRRSIWASVWCYVRQKQMKCWWQRWLIRPCYPVPCNHLLTRPIKHIWKNTRNIDTNAYRNTNTNMYKKVFLTFWINHTMLNLFSPLKYLASSFLFLNIENIFIHILRIYSYIYWEYIHIYMYVDNVGDLFERRE